MTAESENNYAIIRMGKLRTTGEIIEAEKHNSRLIKVINADKSRSTSNIDFRESPTKLVERITARFEKIGIKPRPKAIKAFEVLMSFSPGMRGKINVQEWGLTCMRWAEDRWGTDNILHAIMHHDEKTPHLHLVVTPIVAYTGSRKFKNQFRLNFRDLFGGTDKESMRKLSALQTDYAKAMEPYGLRRGIFNSKRTKKTIKQLYKETELLREKAEQDIADVLKEFTELAKARKKIPEQTEVDSEENRARYADQLFDELNVLRKKTATAFAKLVEKASTAWRADVLERERKLFEEKLENEKEHFLGLLAQRQETIRNWEEINKLKDQDLASSNETIQALRKASKQNEQLIADLRSQARAIPVTRAIKRLTGIAPRETENPGEVRFIFANGLRLIVNEDGRFKNETPDIVGGGTNGSKSGGRGAIDAVLFLKNWNPIEAIEWLATTFSLKEIGPTIGEMEPTDRKDINRENAKREIKAITEKSIKDWPDLREKLVGQGLDAPTIDALHTSKWLSATANGLVRITRATENPEPLPGEPRFEPTGVLIQDPEHTDPSLGFRYETGDNGHTPVIGSKTPWVILCDDAIEALAIATREKKLPDGKRSTVIMIGRQKTSKTERFLRELAKKFKTIIIAISTTPAAKAFAAWIASVIPDAQLRLPPQGLQSHLEAISLPLEPIVPPEKEKPNLLQDPDCGKDDKDSY